MLFAVNFVAALIAALALTVCCRPTRWGGWAAGFAAALAFVVVVISEIAGRIAYTPLGLTIGALIAGGFGTAFLIYRRRDLSFPARIASRGPMLPRIALWSLVAVWFALALWVFYAQAIAPPLAPDALRYHLAAPAHWMAQDRIGLVIGADYRVNHFPHVMSLLLGWPIVLTGGDYLSGLFPVVTTFLLWPATVYLITRTVGAPRDAGLVLALCSAMVPPIFIQGANEAVDVMFWSSALFALYLAIAGREAFARPSLMLGIAVGLTLGTKLYGIAVAPIVLLLWLGLEVHRARWLGEPLFRLVAPSLTAGLAAMLAGLWVYWTNIAGFGNPIYPYQFAFDLQAGQRAPEMFENKSVLSGEAGPLYSLWQVLRLTPELLTGRPPLERDISPNASGFDTTVTAMMILAAGFAVVSLIERLRGQGQRGERRQGLLRWAALFAAVFALNAILASQWGAQLVNKTPPDFSSLGRYQLFWPAMVAALAAALAPRGVVARWVGFTAILIVFALNARHYVLHGQIRGLEWVQRAQPEFPDRALQLSGSWYFMHPDIAALLNEDPAADLLLIGTPGFIYPFFYPDYERQVYKSGFVGTDRNVLFNWPFDRTIYHRLAVHDMPDIASCYRRLQRMTGNEWMSVERPREGLIHMYNSQIVFERGVEYVLIFGDRGHLFDRDPRFREVMDLERAGADIAVFAPKTDRSRRHDALIRCVKTRAR